MGDAELKSNLGERFLAKINVTDVETPPEASCFSATDVGDTPAIRKVSINLKSGNNGNYQLTITSNDVISEPIVNLRVSFHCEPNINREYVLLLDPAPLPAIEKASAGEVSPVGEPSIDNAKKSSQQPQKTRSKKSSTVDVTGQTDNDSATLAPLKKVAKKKKPKNTSSVDEKLLEAYTGKQNTNTSPQASASSEGQNNSNTDLPHQSADKPFLVISAGNGNLSEGADKPGLSLRLATEIDVTRPDEVATTQSSTDTLDEVTVMSNRLAHLEKQIASLQARNAQLVSEAQISKEESESFDWLQFAKIILGLLIVLGLVEMIRRKLSNRKSQAKDAWFDSDEPTDYSKSNSLNASSRNELNLKNTGSLSLDEPISSEPQSQSFHIANSQTIALAEKEVQSSIIEDADVFIEHGRPALAIQLLQNHLSESPSESPAIWLKLLNLLSKEESETEYDLAVIECNKHFNIKAAKFSSHSDSNGSSIEDYPHIVTRLEGVWGSPYAVGFLNDLIFNKRSQPREGLAQGAFNDLFFLKNIAKNLEYANSSIYKASPEQSNSNQLSLNQPNVSKAIIATANTDNAKFNDTLFTDIEPLLETSKETVSKLNDIDSGKKSNFNSFEDETSYEVNILSSDDILSEISNRAEHIEFEVPQKNSTPGDDKSLRAEEIDFSLPVEKVEYATGAEVFDLTDEIVLDDSDKMANKNANLEFSLDFPNEVELKQVSTKEKNKAKNKAKPSDEIQSESNEIEWDLPSVAPESGK